ncbi:MAG: hypothetical protein COV75_08115 [Candidatus Omnitrophica bacterium CG11_big_fil_rev_8_21_14_0_20_63_9]|nr:MAG: hypothetical protein COV75_08115 [Candidatus Omnitrophica bacterium CG11_big_fil_rev_8_21_14_0_20_63_9]
MSSRIRRAVFEHILAHPTDRFYLRGLAKTLDLSVSPLRRELKRLEHSGLLQACQEGNMLFYTVKTASPMFLQLHQLGREPEPAAAAIAQLDVPPAPVEAPAMPQPVSRRSRAPWLVGALGVGMALVAVIGGLAFQVVGQAPQPAYYVSAPRVEAVRTPEPSVSSGVMHGSRWRIEPGGIGGFSAGAAE